MLPGGEKELAWEFVESKARAEEVIDDFVPEKGTGPSTEYNRDIWLTYSDIGRGMIILMFGPPGVGKTYTAEAGR